MELTAHGRAVIFDLDGTLLNTLEDVAAGINDALAAAGYPIHPADAYRHFTGDGIRNAFRRALPEAHRDEATVEAVVADYGARSASRHHTATRPYAGIPELLDELTRRGVPRAVFSNKRDNATQRVIPEYLGGWTFTVIRGARDDTPLKPAPDGAWIVAQALGTRPSDILYLGDTSTDMRCAIAAGMIPLGAAWGFRDAAELRQSGAAAVLESPLELLDWLAAG